MAIQTIIIKTLQEMIEVVLRVDYLRGVLEG